MMSYGSQDTKDSLNNCGGSGDPHKQPIQKQDQMQMQKKNANPNHQQQTQDLAADIYCRLYAQIEKILNMIKPNSVPTRFKEFECNSAESDLQDHLLGMEGYLDAMTVFEVDVVKKQLQPLVYPKADDAIRDFKQAIDRIPKTADYKSTINVLKYAINCFENPRSFKNKFPNELSYEIMSKQEREAYLKPDTPEKRTAIVGVHHDSQKLQSKVAKKLDSPQPKPKKLGGRPSPLLDEKEIHSATSKNKTNPFL